MKNFLIIFVVALATLQCASALKCWVCSPEAEKTCQDTQKSEECLEPESLDSSAAEASAVNCFAIEASKFFLEWKPCHSSANGYFLTT